MIVSKKRSIQGRVCLLLPRVSVTLVLKIADFSNPGKHFCVWKSQSVLSASADSVYPEFLGILNVPALHGRS